MRSITATMWVTLDGVVQGLARTDEDTRGGFTHGGWGPRYDDEVLGREMANAIAKPGDMLLGARNASGASLTCDELPGMCAACGSGAWDQRPR